MDETFVNLYSKHQRTLHSLIRTLCRSPEDTDDIFQNTTIVLWRKFDDFEPGTNFLAWAASIARYEVLDFAKRKGRSALLFDSELIAQITERAATHAENADSRLQALRTCLHKLSEGHRDLLERRYATSGSVNEIASELDRSANSVSVTLHTIRRQLLHCIDKQMAEAAE